MTKTLYMVVEHFKGGDAVPVYQRFREHGRFAPQGLMYVSSWVDANLERCYQLVETDDPQLLDDWISQWSDRGSSRKDCPSPLAGRSVVPPAQSSHHDLTGTTTSARLRVRCDTDSLSGLWE